MTLVVDYSPELKKVVKNQIAVKWLVNDFFNVGSVLSKSFIFPQENSPNIKLQLKYAIDYGDIDEDDDVHIHLYSFDQKRHPSLHWQISLITRDNEKFAAEDFVGLDDDNCWSCSLNDLKADYEGPGHYRTLTVWCEIVQLEPQFDDREAQTAVPHLELTLNAIAADYGGLLESSKHSDVILVMEGNELKAHKLILSARSPVFAAMFEHDCEENRENRVNITDMSRKVAQELLRFIYTGKVSPNGVSSDLLVAADKYQVTTLKTLCEDSLSQDLNTNSALSLLVLASMHSAETLMQKCIDYLIEHGDELTKEDWKKIPNDSQLSFALYRKMYKKRRCN